MSGKSIKTLADQLWKNHGVSLITTFDSGIVPGSVLERRSWNDISRVGHLKDGVKAGDLPYIEGPVPCMLADFRRSHETNIGAALRLLQPTVIAIESEFKPATEAVARTHQPGRSAPSRVRGSGMSSVAAMSLYRPSKLRLPARERNSHHRDALRPPIP